jgi:hypothetical protein
VPISSSASMSYIGDFYPKDGPKSDVSATPGQPQNTLVAAVAPPAPRETAVAVSFAAVPGVPPCALPAALRGWEFTVIRISYHGFRVARTLTP